MKSSRALCGLAAVGLMAGVSAPANAVLQLAADVSGSTLFCADNTACDTNPAVGIIQIAPFTLNGVRVNGETITSVGTPGNPGLDTLNVSNLSVTNTTGVVKTINAVVSDTDFLAPVTSWESAGSGTWQGTIGSTITLNWWDDPANGQGANDVTDTPGILVDTFSGNATGIVQGFSHNGTGAAGDTAPFSMTEQAIYTLQPGGELLNCGETLVKSAIPEPSTWVMLVLGFAGLGYASFRASRKREAIVD